MEIKRTDKIGCLRILDVRNYMRKLSSKLSSRGLQNYFNLSDIETEGVIRMLIDRDFITRVGDNQYIITQNGNSFRIANCVSPMSQTKADLIFMKFMERVSEINTDDKYLYRVSRVLLFGSYLDKKKNSYNDIDLAIELTRKISNKEEFEQLRQTQVDKAIEEGHDFRSFVEELCYCEKIVWLKLKDRCKYISLHSMNDGVLEKTKIKQVYPNK